MQTSFTRYHGIAILIHWAVAVLILLAIGL